MRWFAVLPVADMVAACEPIAGTCTLRALIPNGVSSYSSASRSIASPSEVLVKRVHWRVVLGLWALSLGACSTQTYDLVIANGRVMDPESGFDRVAHVGIVGSRIEAISGRPLRGNRSIDASGLVVAPGLIELHTHGEDKLNYEFRAMDGVTTMLDTERGTVDVDKWYADRDGKTLVNYGISAGHRARAGGWRQVRGVSLLGAGAYQRGDAGTDRQNRVARPARAHPAVRSASA